MFFISNSSLINHYHRIIGGVLIVTSTDAYFLKSIGFVKLSCRCVFASDLKEHRLNATSALGFQAVGKKSVSDASPTLVLSNRDAVDLPLGRNFSADYITHNSTLVGGAKAHSKVGADVGKNVLLPKGIAKYGSLYLGYCRCILRA